MRKQEIKREKHERWHDYFAERIPVFRAPFQQNPVDYVEQLFGHICNYMVQSTDKNDHPSYRVHAWLHIIHISERTIMFYHLRPVTREIEQLNRYFIVQVNEAINQYNFSDTIDKNSLSAIVSVLGKYSFHHPHSPIQWLSLFRLFWSKLLVDPVLRQAEYDRLVTLSEKKSRDAELRQMESVAAMHFLVLDGQHEEALVKIRDEKLKPTLFFDYLRTYRENGEDALRMYWLQGLSRLMGNESVAIVSAFLQEWLDGIVKDEEAQQWREVAIQLLPASLKDLSDYYLRRHDVHHWADLYMSLGLEPWQKDHSTYVRIHRECPDVLLPIYHQSIEVSIESKSRTGYRDAVKWMKVVREIYGQLNQEKVWERYFAYMMERTGRLRAFQEELEKGGMLQ